MSDGVIQLFIRGQTAASRWTVAVPFGCAVSDLKAAIAHVSGIPSDQQRLSWSHKGLEDDRLLSDFELNDGSTIDLVLRLRSTAQDNNELKRQQDAERDQLRRRAQEFKTDVVDKLLEQTADTHVRVDLRVCDGLAADAMPNLRPDLLRGLRDNRTVTHLTFQNVPPYGLRDEYAHAVAANPCVTFLDVGTTDFHAAPLLQTLSASYSITELRGAAFRGGEVLEYAVFLQLRNRRLAAHPVPRARMSAAEWQTLVDDTSALVRVAVRGITGAAAAAAPVAAAAAAAAPSALAAAAAAAAAGGGGGRAVAVADAAAASAAGDELVREAEAVRAAMFPPAVTPVKAAHAAAAVGAAAAAAFEGTGADSAPQLLPDVNDSTAAAAAAAAAAERKAAADAAETAPQRAAREAAERVAQIERDKQLRPLTDPARYAQLGAVLQQVFGGGGAGVLPAALQRLVLRYEGSWGWAVMMCKPTAQPQYLVSDELETVDRFRISKATATSICPGGFGMYVYPVLSLAVPPHVPHYAHLNTATVEDAARGRTGFRGAGGGGGTLRDERRVRVLSCFRNSFQPDRKPSRWVLRDVLADTECLDDALQVESKELPTAACFLDTSPLLVVGLANGSVEAYSVSQRVMRTAPVAPPAAAAAAESKLKPHAEGAAVAAAAAAGEGPVVGATLRARELVTLRCGVPVMSSNGLHKSRISEVLELSPLCVMGSCFPLLATSSWDKTLAVSAIDHDETDDAVIAVAVNARNRGHHRTTLKPVRRYGDPFDAPAASRFEAGVYSMCRVGNDWLVGGSYDHALAFDIDTGACVANLKQPKMWAVNALCPIPARNLLALGSSDGKVRLYDTRLFGARPAAAGGAAAGGGAAAAQPQFVLDVPSEYRLTDGGVAKLVLLPDGHLLSCTGSGTLRAFDLRATSSGGAPTCLPQVWRESVDPFVAAPSDVCCYVVRGP